MKDFIGGTKKMVGMGVFVALLASQVGTAFAAVTVPNYPLADGTNLAWTPSTGTTHFTLVDETTCNGVTDYVSTVTVGNRDSYRVDLSGVPTGAAITGVAIKLCASRNSTGSGSSVLNVFYRLNGVASADAGAYSLPANVTPAGLATTSFSGLFTLKNASTTLEVGAVYTSGTKGARLSNIATVITYEVAPAAPSALTAVATSSNTAVALSWTDNATNETGFTIERSINGGSFAVIASTTANVTSFLNTGLSFGSYQYRVKAQNAVGSSAYTNASVSLLPAVPAAPSALTAVATSSNTAVALSWTDNSSNEDAFVVQRSTDGVSYSVIASTTPNTISLFDAGLSFGTYYYRVMAVNGGGASAFATTSITLTQPVPAAPSALTAVATSSLTAAALSWTDNSSNESGFIVERSTDNISFSVVGSTSANVRSYLDAGLANGTYYYRVQAVNAGGASAYATAAQPVVLTVPASPSNLVGTSTFASGTAMVQLSWTDNSSNESQFVVERSMDGVVFGVVLTPAANSTTATDFFSVATSTYYYRVSAKNVLGTSTPSAVRAIQVI